VALSFLLLLSVLPLFLFVFVDLASSSSPRSTSLKFPISPICTRNRSQQSERLLNYPSHQDFLENVIRQTVEIHHRFHEKLQIAEHRCVVVHPVGLDLEDREKRIRILGGAAKKRKIRLGDSY
jgi:hypothetical protein